MNSLSFAAAAFDVIEKGPFQSPVAKKRPLLKVGKIYIETKK